MSSIVFGYCLCFLIHFSFRRRAVHKQAPYTNKLPHQAIRHNGLTQNKHNFYLKLNILTTYINDLLYFSLFFFFLLFFRLVLFEKGKKRTIYNFEHSSLLHFPPSVKSNGLLDVSFCMLPTRPLSPTLIFFFCNS